MMMLIRPMIYSKVPYLLFLMNTSPSRLKIFLMVEKVNLGLLLGYYSCYSQEMTPGKKPRQNPERFLTDYRRHRNLLTKVTRTAREQYYHNLLMSSFGNSKKVWSNINTILGKNRKASSTSIKQNGIIINEPEVIPNSFNSALVRASCVSVSCFSSVNKPVLCQ